MVIESLVPPYPFHYHAFSSSIITRIQLLQMCQKKQMCTATSLHYRKDSWEMKKENSYGLNTLSTKASHKRSKLSPRGKLWLVCQQQVQTGWCRPRPYILFQAPPTCFSRLLGSTDDTQPLRVPWTHRHFVPYFLFLGCPAFAIIPENEEDHMSFLANKKTTGSGMCRHSSFLCRDVFCVT